MVVVIVLVLVEGDGEVRVEGDGEDVLVYLLLVLGRNVEGVDGSSARGCRHGLCELVCVVRGRVGRGDRHVVSRGMIREPDVFVEVVRVAFEASFRVERLLHDLSSVGLGSLALVGRAAGVVERSAFVVSFAIAVE